MNYAGNIKLIKTLYKMHKLKGLQSEHVQKQVIQTKKNISTGQVKISMFRLQSILNRLSFENNIF